MEQEGHRSQLKGGPGEPKLQGDGGDLATAPWQEQLLSLPRKVERAGPQEAGGDMGARGDEGCHWPRQMGKDLISAALPCCLHGTDQRFCQPRSPLHFKNLPLFHNSVMTDSAKSFLCFKRASSHSLPVKWKELRSKGL